MRIYDVNIFCREYDKKFCLEVNIADPTIPDWVIKKMAYIPTRWVVIGVYDNKRAARDAQHKLFAK